MSSHLLRRLRRCRALFALALCAWLAMGSTVWAKSHCCASMDMHGMTSMHADHQGGHPIGHAADHGDGACTCAHAAVDRLTLTMQPQQVPLPARLDAHAWPQDAPQPVYAPPLRPPAV